MRSYAISSHSSRPFRKKFGLAKCHRMPPRSVFQLLHDVRLSQLAYAAPTMVSLKRRTHTARRSRRSDSWVRKRVASHHQ